MSRNSGRADRKAVGALAGLGSAAAIVSAGIAAMATGSVPAAAPQADHSDVQNATLTQATTPGTGNPSGNPAPKTSPVFPGVSQDTTLSTNNPGANSFPFLPLTTQSGIAATPSGLVLSPSTSNSDPLGFGNFGIAPAGRLTVNSDGTLSITSGGFIGINTPLGGGTAPVGVNANVDNQGNVTFPGFNNFLNGLANLPDLKNTTNTTGFASDQPSNPNFDTSFGANSFFVDPVTKQTNADIFNIVSGIQAANDATAVQNAANGIKLPSELFPNGIPMDPTSGSLLGVPGLDTAAAGNFSMFAPIAPAADNVVNTFAPRDPANPSAVGNPTSDNFANIGAGFPDAVNSFVPPTTASSGLPTFPQALAAGNAAANASTPATQDRSAPTAAPDSAADPSQSDSSAAPGLPAPTGTGFSMGDLADPNGAAAIASAAANQVTDPTQLPTVAAIAQIQVIPSGGFSSS